MSQVPIIQLDVNLNANNKAKLLIYEHDNPVEVANSFSQKYKLSEEKRDYLKYLIEDKLNQYKQKNMN